MSRSEIGERELSLATGNWQGESEVDFSNMASLDRTFLKQDENESENSETETN